MNRETESSDLASEPLTEKFRANTDSVKLGLSENIKDQIIITLRTSYYVSTDCHLKP